jgi:hypothetical protein
LLTSNERDIAALDDMWRIPGTKIRFGPDDLIGQVPGMGDATAGIASCRMVFASWRRGVASGRNSNRYLYLVTAGS